MLKLNLKIKIKFTCILKHAFSNILFFDSCNGAQTGHGTPERHNLKKAEWAADVWTSKNRPTPDRKKKVFFFE